MKKLLAILMALTVCGAVAYSVSAEEADVTPEDGIVLDEGADGEAADDAEAADDEVDVEQIIDKLANDPNAQAIAEKIKDAIATGKTKEDVSALLGTLGKYVNGQGFDVKDLQDAGALNEVLLGFLDDAGIDADALDKAIGDSTIAQKVLQIYYKPEATTKATETTTVTNPTPTTYSNPDTGAF